MRVPEMLMRFIRGAMAQGIERLVCLYFFEIVAGNDAIDRVDLGARLPVLVRHDVVFRLGLRNADGFRDTLEQIGHRGATKLKRAGADGLFQSDQSVGLVRLLEIDQDFEGSAKSALGKAVEPLQIDEEEFLGETEILLQQTVAHKAAVRVGQNSLRLRESHLLQATRGKNCVGSPIFRRHGTNGYTQTIQEQELIQRVNAGAFSVEVKADGIDWQLFQPEPAEAFHADADHGPCRSAEHKSEL